MPSGISQLRGIALVLSPCSYHLFLFSKNCNKQVLLDYQCQDYKPLSQPDKSYAFFKYLKSLRNDNNQNFKKYNFINLDTEKLIKQATNYEN